VRLEKALENRSEKPLFLFAHFADPHEPYNLHGNVEKFAELRIDGELHRNVKTSVMSQIDEEVDLAPGEHEIAFEADHLFRIRSFDVYLADQPLEVTWVDSERLKRKKQHHLKVTVPASDEHAPVRLRYWVNDVPMGKTKALRYAQEVNFVDQGIGRFLDTLRAQGLYDDSLIVFTSDHGESLGERGPNGGFYGHVEYLTDEEIHVPLIVKLPAGDPRGPLLERSLGRQVSHVDVTPTILDLVGLDGLPGQTGTTLLTPHTSTHLAETHRPEAKRSQIALRDERYKMILDIEEGTFLMYDLEADPGETVDVFASAERERPDWAARLLKLGSGGSAMPGEEDAARREELQKLGYGGDDE
jgi:arylsulfatase A-like enzyme